MSATDLARERGSRLDGRLLSLAHREHRLVALGLRVGMDRLGRTFTVPTEIRFPARRVHGLALQERLGRSIAERPPSYTSAAVREGVETMTASAGFFFQGDLAHDGRWSFESVGLSVLPKSSLASFAEGGARRMQERLCMPGRIVLSELDAYEGEPGFITEWSADLDKTARFASAIISIGKDLVSSVERVYFFRSSRMA